MTGRGQIGADQHAVEPSSFRSVPETSLRTLLIATARDTVRQLRQIVERGVRLELLSHLDGFPDSARLEAWVDHFRPDLLLVDLSGESAQAEMTIRRLRAIAPYCRIIALNRTLESPLVVAMLRAGACDFWPLPLDHDTVAAGVDHLSSLLRAEQCATQRPRGHVAAFSSAKPGAGASTVAAQTAFALSRITGERVLLLDLNLDSGATCAWLEPQDYDISTGQLLCNPSLVSDPRCWEEVVTPLHGVDFVPAPAAASSEPVDWRHLEPVIESARRAHEYVLLDLPAAAHPASLAALALSAEAFLVTTPDLTSLHLTRRSQDFIAGYGLSRQNIRCIVNRVRELNPVVTEYLENNLKTPVEICLPNDYFSLHASGSAGYPLIGDSRLAQGFRRLARQISNRRQAASLPAAPPPSPALRAAVSA